MMCLTSRQQEVVELLWAGKTHKEIAQELNISPSAVRVYLWRAKRKMGGDISTIQLLIRVYLSYKTVT